MQRIPDPRTPDEVIEGVRSHLLESIRLRLRADVPIGIYLSGGIDSSVIAGMTTHLMRSESVSLGSSSPRSRITCFSVAFDEDSGFDESAIANRTADWLGVKYIKKHMNEDALAQRFEDATWHAEHTNPDLNYVGKYALSEVPQEEGFKVVLTGEGSDEQFAGYPAYLPDYLREQDLAWPIHNTLSEAERLVQLDKTETAARVYYKSRGADIPNRASDSPAARMLNQVSTPASMSAFQPQVFAPWTFDSYGTCDPRATIANNVDGKTRLCVADKWHPLNTAMYVWQKGHLANLILSCLGDRGEMAHSIEARTPFLDHRFTEYCNSLPVSAKIRWQQDAGASDGKFIEKWVLREAAKPFITKELYERKKHPYSAPTTWPTDGPLHLLFQGLITEDNVGRLGFIDWDKCKGLVDAAFASGDGSVTLEDQAKAIRLAIVVAQWVVLGRRFGIERARPIAR